ncbi:MAG: hypothetical protein SCJ94_11915 [Bacillota bacterium]|nr:hypothetical protein [Bacillota bacterium]
MGELCTVCKHQDLEKINLDLVQGVLSYRDLASKYDLGRMALQRHNEKHLPQLLVKGSEAKKSEMADKLLFEIERLHAKAWELIDQAERDKKFSAAVSAIKEARSSLELQAKLAGELKTGSTINILVNPQWVELRTLIYKTLEPYPEVKLKLAEELSKAGAADEIIDL